MELTVGPVGAPDISSLALLDTTEGPVGADLLLLVEATTPFGRVVVEARRAMQTEARTVEAHKLAVLATIVLGVLVLAAAHLLRAPLAEAEAVG